MPQLRIPVLVSRLLLWTAAATLIAGCGLGDYEALLRKNRVIVKQGEEDRKLLGDPIDLPAIKEGDTTAPPLNEMMVFLRPPKLFKCKTAPVQAAWEKNTQLLAYQGSDGCSVILAASTSKDLDAAEFERTVWTAFGYYLTTRLPKQVVESGLGEKKVNKKVELIPPRTGREEPAPLRFDLWVWEEPPDGASKVDPKAPPTPDKERAVYSFYFYRPDPTLANNHSQLVVIYQTPLSRFRDPAYEKGIEASIKSLAVDAEGALRRYNASKKQ
jgi:hypothetical protein